MLFFDHFRTASFYPAPAARNIPMAVPDDRLLRRMCTETHSGLPTLRPALIIVPYDNCIFCGAPLHPAQEGVANCGTEHLTKDQGHIPLYYSRKGKWAAWEMARHCSNEDCGSEHFCSFAVQSSPVREMDEVWAGSGDVPTGSPSAMQAEVNRRLSRSSIDSNLVMPRTGASSWYAPTAYSEHEPVRAPHTRREACVLCLSNIGYPTP